MPLQRRKTSSGTFRIDARFAPLSRKHHEMRITIRVTAFIAFGLFAYLAAEATALAQVTLAASSDGNPSSQQEIMYSGTISGLRENNPYYVLVSVTDSQGNVKSSVQFTFIADSNGNGRRGLCR